MSLQGTHYELLGRFRCYLFWNESFKCQSLLVQVHTYHGIILANVRVEVVEIIFIPSSRAATLCRLFVESGKPHHRQHDILCLLR